MLCEEIRRIALSLNLPEFDGGIFDTLLYPESARINVPKLAEAGPTTYSDGRCGIRPHPEVNLPTEVFKKSLIAKTHT